MKFYCRIWSTVSAGPTQLGPQQPCLQAGWSMTASTQLAGGLTHLARALITAQLASDDIERVITARVMTFQQAPALKGRLLARLQVGVQQGGARDKGAQVQRLLDRAAARARIQQLRHLQQLQQRAVLACASACPWS